MWVSGFQSFMVGRWLQTKTKKFHKFGWILWLCKDACILEHDFSFVQEDLSTSPFNTARLPRVVLFESVFSWLSWLWIYCNVNLALRFSFRKNQPPTRHPPGRPFFQSRLSLLWRLSCPGASDWAMELGLVAFFHRIRVICRYIYLCKTHKNQPFM